MSINGTKSFLDIVSRAWLYGGFGASSNVGRHRYDSDSSAELVGGISLRLVRMIRQNYSAENAVRLIQRRANDSPQHFGFDDVSEAKK